MEEIKYQCKYYVMEKEFKRIQIEIDKRGEDGLIVD